MTRGSCSTRSIAAPAQIARLAKCDGLMQDFWYQLDRLERGDIELAREQLAREAQEEQRKAAAKRPSEASGTSARPPAG